MERNKVVQWPKFIRITMLIMLMLMQAAYYVLVARLESLFFTCTGQYLSFFNVKMCKHIDKYLILP